jgi:2-polyprenyl-6-methoxyphenol hydroxylase-like FAD-dependent oxidoreductase
MDLPQSLMEPILIKWATRKGWKVRFDTELISFVDEEHGLADNGEKDKDDNERNILAIVVDNLTGLEYQIRTKYLLAADGGRSTVAKRLDLPFTAIPGGGYATNVLLRADLKHLMEYRQGNLHVVLRLEKDYPFVSVIRMVKPWTEWMLVFFPKGPDAPIPKRSFTEWEEVAKDIIGDEEIEVEVLDVSGWAINETSADVISKGNV